MLKLRTSGSTVAVTGETSVESAVASTWIKDRLFASLLLLVPAAIPARLKDKVSMALLGRVAARHLRAVTPLGRLPGPPV